MKMKKNGVDFPINIIWNDNNNSDLNRPSDVTVHLYGDGVEVDTFVLDSGHNWEHTFWELPKYKDDDETEIIYAINLNPIDYYTSSIDDGTITLTYTPELTSETIIVAWENDDFRTRPNSLTAKLYKNNNILVGTVTLNEANEWTNIIDNLPTIYNGDTANYSYTIEEDVLEYTMSYSINDNVTVFTYTLTGNTPPPPPGDSPK